MKELKETQEKIKKRGETLDVIRGGEIKVLQKKRGYRYSIDAVLLADYIKLKPGERVLDLGTGSGIVSLVLAARFRNVDVTGMEIQEELAGMARRSVQLNGLNERVTILCGDIRNIGEFLEHRSFDVACTNPPYRKLLSGRVNADHERAIARHEIKGTITDFIAAARYVLKEGGRLYCIYPARRAVELIAEMRQQGMEPKRARMVHTNRSSRADFILVEGVKGGGEEMDFAPPLFIYGEDGGYSEEMEAIFGNLTRPRELSE